MMILFFILLPLLPSTLGAPTPYHDDPFVNDVSKTDQAPVIGYDCNQTEPEILTLSALDVGPCPEIGTFKPNTRLVWGQLIQKKDFEMVRVRTCQLLRSTFYFKCGGSWANYQVYPPSIDIIERLDARACNSIHDTGIFVWSAEKQPWGGLEINSTNQMSSNEVGWTDKYGYCQGGTHQMNGQEYDNVVVQVSLTLSIRESWSKVERSTGNINIESLQCPYAKGYCHDAMTGSHTWVSTALKCPDDSYVQLYKGPMNITSSDKEGIALLSINRPPFLFSSELGTSTYACGLNMQLTEFPDIFLVPQVQNSYQVSLNGPDVQDVQFITYLNAKMTFTYHNLMDSARDMYLNALKQTCEVEREMLKNRIEIIRLNSNTGALSTLMQGGMFARANGEVLHLIKCEPVHVTLRNTEFCHEALPITYKNQQMFLLPNTRIITQFSPEIPCTPITPVTYKIGGKWWAFTGHYTPVNAPEIIKPKDIKRLPFNKIRSFSRGGMYAIEQIEAVQRLLSFPNLRDAITTNIAAGVTRYYGRPITMDVTSIMSEADWENMAKSHLKRFWGFFSEFGNAISGLIGFYVIYCLLKGAIRVIFDLKELYQSFGWSFKMLSVIVGRIARYFIDQGREFRSDGSRRKRPEPPSYEDSNSQETTVELRETSLPRQVYPGSALTGILSSAPELA